MSNSLQYKIIVPEEPGYLPDELKYILREKYELGQGVYQLKYTDRDYLQGLSDAGIDGAKELLDHMNKGETIEIWIGA